MRNFNFYCANNKKIEKKKLKKKILKKKSEKKVQKKPKKKNVPICPLFAALLINQQ